MACRGCAGLLLLLGLLQLLGRAAACPCQDPRLCQPIAGTGNFEVRVPVLLELFLRAGWRGGAVAVRGDPGCPGRAWCLGLLWWPWAALGTSALGSLLWSSRKSGFAAGKGLELMRWPLTTSRSLCSMWGRKPGNPMTGQKLQPWQLSGNTIQSSCALLIPKAPG